MERTVLRSCLLPVCISQYRQQTLSLSFSHQLFYHIFNPQLLLARILLRYASFIAEHKGPSEKIQISPFLPQEPSARWTSPRALRLGPCQTARDYCRVSRHDALQREIFRRVEELV